MNTTIKFYIFELVYIHGRNILELYNILEKFRFTTSKAVVDIYYKKLSIVDIYYKDSRLRKLGS